MSLFTNTRKSALEHAEQTRPLSVLDGLEILHHIQLRLGGVTEVHVLTFGSRMTPPEKNEKALGVVHGEQLKKMYCLSMLARGRADSLEQEIGIIIDPEQEAEFRVERLVGLEIDAICRELFWAEVRREFNCYNSGIGLRKDWMVVAQEEGASGPPRAIAAFLKGFGLHGLQGEIQDEDENENKG